MAYLSDKREKWNVGTALLGQFVSIVCGLIVPRAMIGAFGSEAYGATASIAQFLSYIALLEGGITGVARAALYPPLAEGDLQKVSGVYRAIQGFYTVIGGVFLIYSLLLGLSFHKIADIDFLTWQESFLLVLIISLSTMGQYFCGISGQILLNSDQRQYVGNLCSIIVTLLNTGMICLLTTMGKSLLAVKLLSGLIFLIKPLFFRSYVKRHYCLPFTEQDKSALQQKWTGLAQHLAYFLHRNTDIVLLTLFAEMKLVAVYAVHSLVANSIRNLVLAFTGGMESRFGQLLAKGELGELQALYRQYQRRISAVVLIFFGTAAAMVTSFVELYTKGVSDAAYVQPKFAFLLLLAEGVYCLSLPYSSLPVAANRFRESRWGAYGEAALNIALSCVLMRWDPLAGAALGTLISAVYRNLYYLKFSAERILKLSFHVLLREHCRDFILLAGVSVIGMECLDDARITTFAEWILCSGLVFLCLCGAALLLYYRGGKRDEEAFHCE